MRLPGSRSLVRFAFVLLLPTLLGADDCEQKVVQFTDNYLGNFFDQATCDWTYPMIDYEPASGTDYPVFVHTHSTLATHSNVYSQENIKKITKKRFVTVSIHYENNPIGLGCAELDKKANCTYNQSETASAMSQTYTHPKANCSRSIVMSGLNQDNHMAMRTMNHNPNVRAAHATAVSRQYTPPLFPDYEYDVSTCIDDGNRALPANHLRIIHKQADTIANLTDLQLLSKMNCPPEQPHCLQPNGNNYYLMLNNKTEDNQTDHYLAIHAEDENKNYNKKKNSTFSEHLPLPTTGRYYRT